MITPCILLTLKNNRTAMVFGVQILLNALNVSQNVMGKKIALMAQMRMIVSNVKMEL